ncbi:MAG: hypothetical protein L7U56_00020 [Acidimicrobiales bacterium]|nr:hypothetical protein [Acidimicrobiales bacterium]
MITALLGILAQSTDELGDPVAQDSGAVFVVGFILVGVVCVVGAAIHRKRRG